jgi:nicotinamide mononucleotide transporter
VVVLLVRRLDLRRVHHRDLRDGRGWNEFWLAWIGVDLIGVPLGFATGYVPTAVMYIGYGIFVLYGFTQWVKATRLERAGGAGAAR